MVGTTNKRTAMQIKDCHRTMVNRGEAEPKTSKKALARQQNKQPVDGSVFDTDQEEEEFFSTLTKLAKSQRKKHGNAISDEDDDSDDDEQDRKPAAKSYSKAPVKRQ